MRVRQTYDKFMNRILDKSIEMLQSKQQIVDVGKLDQLIRGGSINSFAKVAVTPDSAMLQSTTYACIQVLAESLGQLPFFLYKRDGDEFEIATDHSLHELLHHAPNSFLTAQEMDELIVTEQCLRGNSFWFMTKVNDKIVEFLPIPPDTVTLKVDNQWNFVYTVRDSDTGETKTYGSDTIWHTKNLSLNGYWGLTPIQQARNSIGLAIATERHGSRFFANYGVPNGAFKVNAVLTEEQEAATREKLNHDYGGHSEHSIGLLQGDIEWISLNVSNKDSQQLETRQYQREDICGMFRVPPHMVGDMSRSTFNNIEHSTLSFIIHSMTPWMTRKSASARQFVLTKEEKQQGYFFDYVPEAFLKGDLVSRVTAYAGMITNGIMSPNEIRALEKRSPREGGNEFVQPRSPQEPAPSRNDSIIDPNPIEEDENNENANITPFIQKH